MNNEVIIFSVGKYVTEFSEDTVIKFLVLGVIMFAVFIFCKRCRL